MLSNFSNFKDIKGLGNVKHHLHRILHNTLGNQKLQTEGGEEVQYPICGKTHINA